MDREIEIVVGRALRTRRRLLGLTQQDLGARCGVSFQTIQKYECADTRMSVAMLWKLAGALDVEVSYFFAGYSGGEAGRGRYQANCSLVASSLPSRRQ